jgi:hypothetical protein
MKSSDGKRSGSKFRINKRDAAHGDGENGGKMPKMGGESAEKMGGAMGGGEGVRSQANKAESRPSGAMEEKLEEQVHPGIHEAIKNLATEHGPAVETHTSHDHAAGSHHLHTVHGDGHQHHSDHATAEDAHQGAAEAAGAMMPGGEPEQEPEMGMGEELPMDQKKKKMGGMEEDDSYHVPEL